MGQLDLSLQLFLVFRLSQGRPCRLWAPLSLPHQPCQGHPLVPLVPLAPLDPLPLACLAPMVLALQLAHAALLDPEDPLDLLDRRIQEENSLADYQWHWTFGLIETWHRSGFHGHRGCHPCRSSS